MIFCFITETKLVSPSDLYRVKQAIEPCAVACARAWALDPNIAIDVFADRKTMPRGPDFFPVVFLGDDSEDPGTLAVHFAGGARVYVGRSSGLLAGPESVSEAASHEVNEALVDPFCDLYTHCPGRPAGVETPLESVDALQDSYVLRVGNDDVQVANFLHREWFADKYADADEARRFLDAGGKFDHMGRLSRAGEIGPEGYLMLRQGDRRWLENAAGGMASRTKPGATHPMSRTERRLAA